MKMIEIFGGDIDRYIYAILIFTMVQLFRVVFKKLLMKVVSKTTNIYDDDILNLISKQINLIFVFIGLSFAKFVLVLDASINEFLNHIISSSFIIIVFWSLLKLLNYFVNHLEQITNRFGDKLSKEVANFIVKFIRLFLIAIGTFTTLKEWGYDISSFLASLGLIGMAFALAAKDTAANLFGSLVLFTDKPFKVGEWIKTPDVEGTIETIGIRSTRVRTFAQALVTVPNAVLANSAILNWSKMGKRRIKMNLGLTYSTTAEQIENIVKDIKLMLKHHKDINQETIYIHFTTFEDSSLNIFCYFFTNTTNWGEFMEVRENTNLEIMKIVEKHNSSFAFPSQSIYIESENKKEELI